MDDAQREVAEVWDEAAEGYEEYFVPRFAPWVADAVAAVAEGLPPGPILVPCCGTFPELPALRQAYPERELVGIDLAAGMVELARARAAGLPGVQVVQGDAAQLDARWTGACAAVVSVFGLQVLPDPAAAVGNWVGALRPGGRLSVMYWPPDGEDLGPFDLLRKVLAPHRPPAEDAEEEADWTKELPAAVAAAGGTLERHDNVIHQMSHDDPASFWTGMMTGCAGRSFARTQPSEVVAAARAEFLERAPEGEWSHWPLAKHLVVSRG